MKFYGQLGITGQFQITEDRRSFFNRRRSFNEELVLKNRSSNTVDPILDFDENTQVKSNPGDIFVSIVSGADLYTNMIFMKHKDLGIIPTGIQQQRPIGSTCLSFGDWDQTNTYGGIADIDYFNIESLGDSNHIGNLIERTGYSAGASNGPGDKAVFTTYYEDISWQTQLWSVKISTGTTAARCGQLSSDNSVRNYWNNNACSNRSGNKMLICGIWNWNYINAYGDWWYMDRNTYDCNACWRNIWRSRHRANYAISLTSDVTAWFHGYLWSSLWGRHCSSTSNAENNRMVTQGDTGNYTDPESEPGRHYWTGTRAYRIDNRWNAYWDYGTWVINWLGIPFKSNWMKSIHYSAINTGGDCGKFGDITYGNYHGDSTSNQINNRGIFIGGWSGSAGYCCIDYITISSGSNSVRFGELWKARWHHSSASSGIRNRAVVTGGSNASTEIDYFTITSLGDSSVFGNLSRRRHTHQSVSDS